MKKTLIPKLIFGYVLFVVLGFIILCTFTQHAITHYAEHFIPTIEVLKVIIERLEGLQNGN